MSAEERIGNEDVLKSMNFKLNYKRNPHNNPETIQNILTRPLPSTQIERGTLDHLSTTQKKSQFKSPFVETLLFLAEPSVVEFSSYDKGQVLRRSISFRNISTISRTLRVVSPNTKFFTMSPLMYPLGKYKYTNLHMCVYVTKYVHV